MRFLRENRGRGATPSPNAASRNISEPVCVTISRCTTPCTQPRRPPPLDPSQIGTVETGDIARSVVATGKVQPITEVEVKSKASGIVTKLDTDINTPSTRARSSPSSTRGDPRPGRRAKAQLAAAVSSAHSAAAAVEFDKVAAEAPDLPMFEHSYQRASRCRRTASSPAAWTTPTRSTSPPPTPATKPSPRSPSTAPS
jgi:hypothetical protein